MVPQDGLDAENAQPIDTDSSDGEQTGLSDSEPLMEIGDATMAGAALHPMMLHSRVELPIRFSTCTRPKVLLCSMPRF